MGISQEPTGVAASILNVARLQVAEPSPASSVKAIPEGVDEALAHGWVRVETTDRARAKGVKGAAISVSYINTITGARQGWLPKEAASLAGGRDLQVLAHAGLAPPQADVRLLSRDWLEVHDKTHLTLPLVGVKCPLRTTKP